MVQGGTLTNDGAAFLTPDARRYDPASCAERLRAGWWFPAPPPGGGPPRGADCGRSNPNGNLGVAGTYGAWWVSWFGHKTALAGTTLMVR